MNEARLLFTRDKDGGLTYRMATSWGDAGESQPFVPFLKDDDYEDLRWYLEEYMDLPIGGAKVRAERIEGSLAAWGRQLFDAVFSGGDHRELFNALVDGEAPRLLTVGTRDLDVLRLPWELMADGRGPLTRRGVTLRRQLETARRPEKYETGKLPLRILLAVSRPDDTGFLDPRHTTRAMLDALAPLGDGVVVEFCRPATLDRMERMLADADREGRPFHIVHFDGHGTFLPNSQIGALCFEKEEDAAGRVVVDLVRADRLGQILAAHRIPAAILEACRSGQVGNVAAFRGVAPALIEAAVGSVLSMSHAVHVEATKILLERFYEELAGGGSIGDQQSMGAAAQNIGIVCQGEGEAARKQGDEARARECFAEAARFVGESLDVWRETQDDTHQAASNNKLAQIYLLLGDLAKAEEHAHKAREINERLGLKETVYDYNTLANIARARNRPAEAAAWEQKRDALLAELRRRAGAPALPQQAIQGITQLALTCAQAGHERAHVGADVEEALSTLSTWPTPLDALAPFLRALAAGDVPALPPSLPPELSAGLAQVLDAARQARSGA